LLPARTQTLYVIHFPLITLKFTFILCDQHWETAQKRWPELESWLALRDRSKTLSITGGFSMYIWVNNLSHEWSDCIADRLRT
jgi:hypothetical protein